MSILRQNEQHVEHIEIIANHGPFCKRIKHDKENTLKSIMWKRQRMLNGAFLKSLSKHKIRKILLDFTATSKSEYIIRKLFLSSTVMFDVREFISRTTQRFCQSLL